MSKVLFLVGINLKRLLRNKKSIILVLLLPVILYVISLIQTQDPRQVVNHITLGAYFMVGMITFGILANSLTTFGTNLAKERSAKWFDFLKVSDISEVTYGISQVISFLIFCMLPILVIFIVGITVGKVRLSLFQWISLFILLNLCSIMFALMGAVISCFKGLAQPIGIITLVSLSFLGGSWNFVSSMSLTMQRVAKITPTYNYANLSWSILRGQHLPLSNILFVVGYTILFLVIYVFLNKKLLKSK